MIRRACGRAACIFFTGSLALSGCRAYDARFWSFPLNSMQMVDDAVGTPRTFGGALGMELLFQIFPWSWVVSAVDLLMLPVTLPYDFVELAFFREEPFPFEAQVQARKKQGVARPPAPSAQRVSQAGPGLRNDRGAEHLDPAEH